MFEGIDLRPEVRGLSADLAVSPDREARQRPYSIDEPEDSLSLSPGLSEAAVVRKIGDLGYEAGLIDGQLHTKFKDGVLNQESPLTRSEECFRNHGGRQSCGNPNVGSDHLISAFVPCPTVLRASPAHRITSMSAESWLTLATLLLVAITGYYARKTSQLVSEAIKARRPLLVPLIDFIAPDYAELRLLNAGAGAADTLSLDFGWHPGGPTKHWTGALAAAESENFKLFPKGETLNQYLSSYDSISVTARYTDGLGGSFTLDRTVPIKSMSEESASALRLIAPRTLGDRVVAQLEEIGKKLGEINPKA